MDFKNLTKESLPKEFQERIERFNRLFIEAGDGTFEENDLFGYEMGCIKQALSFTEFFKEMSLEECKAFYEKYPSLFELIEAIKDKLPYFDNGHSGNSMSMSWMLYRCYKEKPELVPYMHGCLAEAGYSIYIKGIKPDKDNECSGEITINGNPTRFREKRNAIILMAVCL